MHSLSNWRRVLIALFVFASFVAQAQYTVSKIQEDGYTAYVSYDLKQPLYVVYDLYKGGGDCDRGTFKAVEGMLGATPYSAIGGGGKGFDKGHLCNAEDFGDKCEATFRYDNCIPQWYSCNRGIWKVWEETVRDESQTKHLKIVAGGMYKNAEKIGKFEVPLNFFKIVIDKRTGRMIHCLVFGNGKNCGVYKSTVKEIKKRCGYTLAY